MKRIWAGILTCCLLLSGCSTWLDGSYYSATPHQEKENVSGDEAIAVSNYGALYQALVSFVEKGSVTGVISVKNYNQLVVARDTRNAIEKLKQTHPIGAYAVEQIAFDLGTKGGQPAIALEITYYHDRAELQKIQHVETMDQAQEAIATALDSCAAGVVLYVESYEPSDLAQWVETYSAANPDKVMETPQVAANAYPETGEQRVVELKFSYQNSRDDLRSMQEQVQEQMERAVNQALEQETSRGKYKQLYAALKETVTGYDTSITPAYSLLIHGVGDSKAISSVYTSLCAATGLTCVRVTGTYQGQPRYWNILRLGNANYHLDVMRCIQEGSFKLMTDSQMNGYVWDYSTYPVCTG